MDMDRSKNWQVENGILRHDLYMFLLNSGNYSKVFFLSEMFSCLKVVFSEIAEKLSESFLVQSILSKSCQCVEIVQDEMGSRCEQ